ncbi:hypothetical protein EJC49_06470 [Aquibium carbonis]|uniref:Apea-like HEPN domain-containing protein n=1 Tax=Aquibium carbonis TaxID=2495581 RepID=A0A429Z0K6_9HYPH|nr:HEPN domain-containing protein [Aquibium carbonis]RST87255.1 hypothetical protein EJC49_06470 [Aquibium carbonis]
MSYVKDVEFILGECVRFSNMKPEDLQTLPVFEALFFLPHPSGRGIMICGVSAYQRICDIADVAISRSLYAGRIHRQSVVEKLKQVIVKRFLCENRDIEAREASKAVNWAINSAAKGTSDTVHLIPCHLGYTKNPEEFSIGPVIFQRTNSVIHRLRADFDDFVDRESNDDNKDTARFYLEKSIEYYNTSGWVAEIKIVGCDNLISESRATRIVQYAIDCVHLLVGSDHSKHIRMGGPSFAPDRRAKIVLNAEGKLSISASVNWLSNGLPEGWWEAQNSKDRAELLALIGCAIEAGCDLPRPAPLAQRFLDSVSWFGEAVRDPFRASRLVKYVTAIERILSTKNEEKLAETLADRGSAMAMIVEGDSREVMRRKFKSVYDLRSRLVHGSRSPHDVGLGQGLIDAEQLTRSVLFGALLFFKEEGLRAKKVNFKSLDRGFERLTEWAYKNMETDAAKQ